MRISDWSSDVCSSDLRNMFLEGRQASTPGFLALGGIDHGDADAILDTGDGIEKFELQQNEIGRASCRERVCQYVSISVVAVSLKNITLCKSAYHVADSVNTNQHKYPHLLPNIH